MASERPLEGEGSGGSEADAAHETAAADRRTHAGGAEATRPPDSGGDTPSASKRTEGFSFRGPSTGAAAAAATDTKSGAAKRPAANTASATTVVHADSAAIAGSGSDPSGTSGGDASVAGADGAVAPSTGGSHVSESTDGPGGTATPAQADGSKLTAKPRAASPRAPESEASGTPTPRSHRRASVSDHVSSFETLTRMKAAAESRPSKTVVVNRDPTSKTVEELKKQFHKNKATGGVSARPPPPPNALARKDSGLGSAATGRPIVRLDGSPKAEVEPTAPGTDSCTVIAPGAAVEVSWSSARAWKQYTRLEYSISIAVGPGTGPDAERHSDEPVAAAASAAAAARGTNVNLKRAGMTWKQVKSESDSRRTTTTMLPPDGLVGGIFLPGLRPVPQSGAPHQKLVIFGSGGAAAAATAARGRGERERGAARAAATAGDAVGSSDQRGGRPELRPSGSSESVDSRPRGRRGSAEALRGAGGEAAVHAGSAEPSGGGDVAVIAELFLRTRATMGKATGVVYGPYRFKRGDAPVGPSGLARRKKRARDAAAAAAAAALASPTGTKGVAAEVYAAAAALAAASAAPPSSESAGTEGAAAPKAATDEKTAQTAPSGEGGTSKAIPPQGALRARASGALPVGGPSAQSAAKQGSASGRADNIAEHVTGEGTRDSLGDKHAPSHGPGTDSDVDDLNPAGGGDDDYGSDDERGALPVTPPDPLILLRERSGADGVAAPRTAQADTDAAPTAAKHPATPGAVDPGIDESGPAGGGAAATDGQGRAAGRGSEPHHGGDEAPDPVDAPRCEGGGYVRGGRMYLWRPPGLFRVVGIIQDTRLLETGLFRERMRVDGSRAFVLHGPRGRRTLATGECQEGYFEDGELHGEGVRVFPSGARYEGKFDHGREHGAGVLTSWRGAAAEPRAGGSGGLADARPTIAAADASTGDGLGGGGDDSAAPPVKPAVASQYRGHFVRGRRCGRGTLKTVSADSPATSILLDGTWTEGGTIEGTLKAVLRLGPAASAVNDSADSGRGGGGGSGFSSGGASTVSDVSATFELAGVFGAECDTIDGFRLSRASEVTLTCAEVQGDVDAWRPFVRPPVGVLYSGAIEDGAPVFDRQICAREFTVAGLERVLAGRSLRAILDDSYSAFAGVTSPEDLQGDHRVFVDAVADGLRLAGVVRARDLAGMGREAEQLLIDAVARHIGGDADMQRRVRGYLPGAVHMCREDHRPKSAVAFAPVMPSVPLWFLRWWPLVLSLGPSKYGAPLDAPTAQAGAAAGAGAWRAEEPEPFESDVSLDGFANCLSCFASLERVRVNNVHAWCCNDNSVRVVWDAWVAPETRKELAAAAESFSDSAYVNASRERSRALSNPPAVRMAASGGGASPAFRLRAGSQAGGGFVSPHSRQWSTDTSATSSTPVSGHAHGSLGSVGGDGDGAGALDSRGRNVEDVESLVGWSAFEYRETGAEYFEVTAVPDRGGEAAESSPPGECKRVRVPVDRGSVIVTGLAPDCWYVLEVRAAPSREFPFPVTGPLLPRARSNSVLVQPYARALEAQQPRIRSVVNAAVEGVALACALVAPAGRPRRAAAAADAAGAAGAGAEAPPADAAAVGSGAAPDPALLDKLVNHALDSVAATLSPDLQRPLLLTLTGALARLLHGFRRRGGYVAPRPQLLPVLSVLADSGHPRFSGAIERFAGLALDLLLETDPTGQLCMRHTIRETVRLCCPRKPFQYYDGGGGSPSATQKAVAALDRKMYNDGVAVVDMACDVELAAVVRWARTRVITAAGKGKNTGKTKGKGKGNKGTANGTGAGAGASAGTSAAATAPASVPEDTVMLTDADLHRDIAAKLVRKVFELMGPLGTTPDEIRDRLARNSGVMRHWVRDHDPSNYHYLSEVFANAAASDGEPSVADVSDAGGVPRCPNDGNGGLQRHRATLYKVLADAAGVPCTLERACVVTGASRAWVYWNVVRIGVLATQNKPPEAGADAPMWPQPLGHDSYLVVNLLDAHAEWALPEGSDEANGYVRGMWRGVQYCGTGDPLPREADARHARAPWAVPEAVVLPPTRVTSLSQVEDTQNRDGAKLGKGGYGSVWATRLRGAAGGGGAAAAATAAGAAAAAGLGGGGHGVAVGGISSATAAGDEASDAQLGSLSLYPLALKTQEHHSADADERQAKTVMGLIEAAILRHGAHRNVVPVLGAFALMPRHGDDAVGSDAGSARAPDTDGAGASSGGGKGGASASGSRGPGGRADVERRVSSYLSATGVAIVMPRASGQLTGRCGIRDRPTQAAPAESPVTTAQVLALALDLATAILHLHGYHESVVLRGIDDDVDDDRHGGAGSGGGDGDGDGDGEGGAGEGVGEQVDGGEAGADGRAVHVLPAKRMIGRRPPVVHNDLKPDNVLVSPRGIAWLADFGVSHVASSTLATDKNMTALPSTGTREYMSPETTSRAYEATWPASFPKFPAFNHKADVWSFGTVLATMFIGLQPGADVFDKDLGVHRYSVAALRACGGPENPGRPVCPEPIVELYEQCTGGDAAYRWPNTRPQFEDIVQTLMSALEVASHHSK